MFLRNGSISILISLSTVLLFHHGKNAYAYQIGFKARLCDIMENFNDLYRNIIGWIIARALKVCLGHFFIKSLKL
jgi:hypothetical protein